MRRAAAKAALASANANPVNKMDIDLHAQSATPSLMEQYIKAFSENTTIGGRKVKDMIADKKKS